MLQNQGKLKVRNSSMELLRIVAMIMIVLHHSVLHGGFDMGASSITIPRLWYNLILLGGKIGVNVFVIISGYYLINDNGPVFNLKKIIKFVGQVFFYSIAIFFIFKLAGVYHLGAISFVKACLPITFSQWWFASAYFVLYLIHPFLNKLLHSIDKSLHQKLILLLIICWSVIPTFTTSSYQSNSLLWFVTLYVISGYIRLYGLNQKFRAKHYFICFLVCSILSYTSTVIFTILGSRWEVILLHARYFYGQEKIPTVLSSFCLFMIFTTLKMKPHKWIDTVASATFGVYLIHENTHMRSFLWTELFKNAQYQESLLLIPYSIIAAALVYAVCTLVDLLRQQIIEKPFMIIAEPYLEKMIILFGDGITLLKNFVFGEEHS